MLSIMSTIYYEQCIRDVCSAQKDRGSRGCGTIATFAWECNIVGIEISDWRKTATCEGKEVHTLTYCSSLVIQSFDSISEGSFRFEKSKKQIKPV